MKKEHELTLILMDEGRDLQEARLHIKNNYVGEFDSMYDFARDYIEEYQVESEHIRKYIDYEAFAADLLLDGFSAYSDKEHNIHIFNDRG